MFQSLFARYAHAASVVMLDLLSPIAVPHPRNSFSLLPSVYNGTLIVFEGVLVKGRGLKLQEFGTQTHAHTGTHNGFMRTLDGLVVGGEGLLLRTGGIFCRLQLVHFG